MILGAGGIGGYLGALLSGSKADVVFMLRPERARRVMADGLRVVGLGLDITCKPPLHDGAPANLVIVSCKGHDLPQAMEDIAPAVRPGTAILSFLNGIAHLDRLRDRFPEAVIWGGVAHVGLDLGPDGIVRKLSAKARFVIGPMPSDADTAPGEQLVGLLHGTDAHIEMSENIQGPLWEKLVYFAALSGITTLTRQPINHALASPDGHATVVGLIDEAVALIPDDVTLDKDAVAHLRAHLTDRATKSGSSMMRDLLAGKQTEHEWIQGDLIARAKILSVKTPLLRACHANLCVAAAIRSAVQS